jgi:hypothetical protein
MAGYFVICLLCRNVEPTMAQERIAAARSSPLQEHISKALQPGGAVPALGQSGASGAGRCARGRWCEFRTPTSTSSASPAQVRQE